MFSDDILLDNLKLFKTDYFRKKYFKEHFDWVGYSAITLGRNNENEICQFYYVSIIESIQNFLKNLNMKKESTDGYLKDFNDGNIYQKSQFFNTSDEKLQIILYQDAFNVCNPLGQYKNTKKMVGVYFSVGNIPSHDRSVINNIQLVLVCREKDVKYFTFQKILLPLVNDLRILEDPCIPPCIAHDLFEGIVNFDLSLILQDMLGDWFNLNTLKATIKSTLKKFNVKDSNELTFKKGKKINCKAAFCWNLVQVLPVVFLELCSEKVESEIYRMFIYITL